MVTQRVELLDLTTTSRSALVRKLKEVLAQEDLLAMDDLTVGYDVQAKQWYAIAILTFEEVEVPEYRTLVGAR